MIADLFRYKSWISRKIMARKISKVLPFQRVNTHGEIFDIYQLGSFKANHSALKGLLDCHSQQDVDENIEIVRVRKNFNYKPHYHKKSAAIIYILSGTGQFILDNNTIDYLRGKRIVVLPGKFHGFKTKEETLFLSIQSPSIVDSLTGEIDIFYT